MTFYITTPIYYVNDQPHIGHAYSTVVADVLTRYHRLWKEESYFLTGTDEHGQKVQAAAKNANCSPQEHVDRLVERFKGVWRDLNIEYSSFIRTTMPAHRKLVQNVLQKLKDQDDIYLHEYQGWYCVSEEIFYTEKDLVDGKSPSGKEVVQVIERNFFFRMSKYQERLLAYIEANPAFVQPAGKRSEVIGFLKQGVNDLCISRPKSRLNWGIDFPFTDDHGEEYVTYVWFDALLNYLTGLNYGTEDSLFDQFWPNAVHLIGKDILVPHTIYWPCMLMALELPLPKTIFAHGWWLNTDNSKMSKSEGPVVRPLDLKDKVGVDPFRYFLCRDITLGNDAQFSPELLISRINSELANNLGNLASRTLNLVFKNFDGKLPNSAASHAESIALRDLALSVADKVKTHIESFELSTALGEIVDLLNHTNRYLDLLAPWKTAKSDLALCAETLVCALESLRIVAILLSPVMPEKMGSLLKYVSITQQISFNDAKIWGALLPGIHVLKPEALFPRVE